MLICFALKMMTIRKVQDELYYYSFFHGSTAHLGARPPLFLVSGSRIIRHR